MGRPYPPVAVTMTNAGGPTPVKAVSLAPKGYEQILSAALAGAKALTVPAGAQYAIVQNNGTAAVRYRDDGTNPTATVGQMLPNGQELFYEGDLTSQAMMNNPYAMTRPVPYSAPGWV
ncbi:hypothetical protein [Brevundimonas vancanneytii]|uniref:Uncharacterized protein n=1 Tax=Brevundimonas vancanneytii TaxID=1325724 RepID=A0A4P1K190_9CAUL|nr:hypothetical protein [Brevundimonas vancanneytii]VTO14115.1 Uncharacterised protein [Brevundimonas vancanneytii]